MVLDPFGLLGVTCNSTPLQVRRQYYAMASVCHPDRGGTNEDMRVVHNAYRYVSDQVALNRRCTYEQVQREFDEFCAAQTSAPPRFVDIHHETFGEFNAAFEASDRVQRAFAEGGVETVKSEVELEYTDVERGTVKPFMREIVVYAAPAPVDMRGFWRNVDGAPITDYGCTLGSMRASDYREAHTEPMVVEYDKTLERDVVASREERARTYDRVDSTHKIFA